MFDSSIKKKRKEALITRMLTPLLQAEFRETAILRNFFVQKIELSKEEGLCNIFIFGSGSLEERSAAMRQIILLAPSTRRALAQILKSRYTPEIRFLFDDGHEKIDRLNDVLLKVHLELKEQGVLPDDEASEENFFSDSEQK